MDAKLKALKIKTGTVKRCTKDITAYQKEATELKGKIAKMREDGKDPYEIKKMEEVLGETRSMIPHTMKNLKKYEKDLQKIVDENSDGIADTPEFAEAQKVLQEAKNVAK